MAAFFWIHAGVNANWATNGNWSATSGGGTNGAQPSVTSDVTFDGAGAHGNEASIVSANQSVLSLTFTSGFTQSVTINTAVILTIAGNFTDNVNHSWIVSGTGSMTISATSTITSGGKTFPGPVLFSGSNTKTLVGDWTITGTLTISGTPTINKTTAEIFTVGGLNVGGVTSGTIDVTINGGTWSGSSAFTVHKLTFDGTVTISGSVAFNSGTLQWTSGTITTTGSTVTVAAATTFDTNGMSFENITISAAATYTINSLLTLTGTLSVNGGLTVSFLGTSGFTVANFTSFAQTAITYTFKNSVTYTITTGLTANRTTTITSLVFASDDGTLKAIINLKYGATCNVRVNFTRIDASPGRPILSFNGTITSCTNVFSYNDVAIPPPNINRKVGRRNSIYNRAKTVQYL